MSLFQNAQVKFLIKLFYGEITEAGDNLFKLMGGQIFSAFSLYPLFQDLQIDRRKITKYNAVGSLDYVK